MNNNSQPPHTGLPFPELPLGLGMAFAQNRGAMQVFSALSVGEQEEFIRRAHTVRSKDEMQALISALGTGTPPGNKTE